MIYFTVIGIKNRIRAYSLLRKYIFKCYVCKVALADKSMKLRILITDMFRFTLQLQKFKVPPEFLFQNGILSSRYNLGLKVICHAISFR